MRDKIIVKYKNCNCWILTSLSRSLQTAISLGECENTRKRWQKHKCDGCASKVNRLRKILHDLHQIFLSIKCYYKIFYRIIRFNDTKKKKTQNRHIYNPRLTNALKIISCFVSSPLRNVQKFIVLCLLHYVCDANATRHMQFLRVIFLLFHSVL